jgi:hypothetical protein
MLHSRVPIPLQPYVQHVVVLLVQPWQMPGADTPDGRKAAKRTFVHGTLARPKACGGIGGSAASTGQARTAPGWDLVSHRAAARAYGQVRYVPVLVSHGVFISYRREDTGPYARLLKEHLSGRLPGVLVFMDVDSIEAGVDFAEAIEAAVHSCAVMVALIGGRWLTAADEEGRRRAPAELAQRVVRSVARAWPQRGNCPGHPRGARRSVTAAHRGRSGSAPWPG